MARQGSVGIAKGDGSMDIALLVFALLPMIAGLLNLLCPRQCIRISRKFVAACHLEHKTPELWFSVGVCRLFGVGGVLFGLLLVILGLATDP
jgi:hypothetical protein